MTMDHAVLLEQLEAIRDALATGLPSEASEDQVRAALEALPRGDDAFEYLRTRLLAELHGAISLDPAFRKTLDVHWRDHVDELRSFLEGHAPPT